jgi:hypothetical protein
VPGVRVTSGALSFKSLKNLVDRAQDVHETACRSSWIKRP